MKHALSTQVPYQQPYVQRYGYRGQGRGLYLTRGAAQGQYKQQVHYGVPPKQYDGCSLQPYQST